jgi:4'-phosphopantetheinyl transferase
MMRPSPLAAATPVQLRGVDAELCLLRISDIAEITLKVSTLDPDERRRAAALRRPEDRRRFVAAHLLLRQLLARRLGMEPQQLTFRRDPCPNCGGPHGRPAVNVPAHLKSTQFSLSHSGDVVLIGIACAPIGVDVEQVPPDRTVSEVAGVLHPEERREIETAPAELRRSAFARIWARKEAYLKGVGIGIGGDLSADNLAGDGAPSGWSVVEVPAGDGYAAAVALRGL